MTRTLSHSRVRTGRRTGWRAGLLLALVLALSGCLKYDLALEVSEDNTLDGTMIVAIAREFAVGDDVLGRNGDITTSQGSVSKEPYEDADYIGSRFVLTDIPISEIGALATDGSSEFTLTREGDEFVLDATLDFNLAGSESIPTDSSFTAMVSFTFPGAVLESNGVISGNTVAWTELSPDAANSLTARASAVANGQAGSTAGSGTPWWVWVLVGVGLLLVLGLVMGFILRRRRDAKAAVPVTAAGWPGQQQQGAYNEYGVWVPAAVYGQESGYHDSGQEGGYGSYYGTYGETPSGSFDYPQGRSGGDTYGGAPGDAYGGPPGTQPQPGYPQPGYPQPGYPPGGYAGQTVVSHPDAPQPPSAWTVRRPT